MINSSINTITAHCTHWGVYRHIGQEPFYHQQWLSHCHLYILMFALILKICILMALHPGHLILCYSFLRVFLDIKIYLHSFPNFPHIHSVICSCLHWNSCTFIFVNCLLLSTFKGPGLFHHLELHIFCAANSHLLIRVWVYSWLKLIF